MSDIEIINGNDKIFVSSEGITIKFDATVKISTITNDKFSLTANPAYDISFQPVDLVENYDSIGRELILYFTNSLTPNTDYEFTVNGLLDVANKHVENYTYTFSTGADVTPMPEPIPEEKVSVIDYSVKSAFSLDNSIFSANPDFYVTDIDPKNGSYFLDEDYNNGRITIKFSKEPDPRFLNSPWIKAQRKKFTHAPTRWENLSVNISKNSNKPWVYIDFPSLDVPSVYVEAGHEYFEPAYKYRIILSKDITT